MKKRLIIMLLGCLVIFGGVFGAKYAGQVMMNQYLDSMPVQPVTISATEVRKDSWQQLIETVGSLTAVNGIEVTTEAAGIVKAIEFESGDRVEQGAVLLRLDTETDAADLRTLEAQAKLADTQLERIRKLYKLDSISKSDLDQAESEAAQAKARVQAQRARLNEKVIRAPFDGELGIRQVDLGQYLSPGTPIVSLQALDPLYADFKLPEQNIGRVRKGQQVNLGIDMLPDEIFEGEIQAIDSRVDEATRNFRVRARVPNPEGLLRPGVFARVTIELPGAEEVLIVPRTAISYNSFGNSVYVVVEKTVEQSQAEEETTPEAKPAEADAPRLVARQRFVKTGGARGDFVIIESGLTEGEQVATSGLLKLRNDQPVKINNEMAPKVEMKPTPEQG